MQRWADPGVAARPRRDDVDEAGGVGCRAVVARQVAAHRDDADAVALHRFPPHGRSVRRELAVGDRIATPGSVHLDEEPGGDLRGRGRDRFAAPA